LPNFSILVFSCVPVSIPPPSSPPICHSVHHHTMILPLSKQLGELRLGYVLSRLLITTIPYADVNHFEHVLIIIVIIIFWSKRHVFDIIIGVIYIFIICVLQIYIYIYKIGVIYMYYLCFAGNTRSSPWGSWT
jgi:hypothetical protein